MSKRFTESIVEDAALEWLEGMGYSVAHGPDIAHDDESPEWASTIEPSWSNGLAGSDEHQLDDPASNDRQAEQVWSWSRPRSSTDDRQRSKPLPRCSGQIRLRIVPELFSSRPRCAITRRRVAVDRA